MKIIFRIILVVVGLVMLIVLFYAEECWRGKRAWENCKRELEAKGEVLDWNKLTPPVVPDEQNIFKAPKMAEWFVKPRSGESLTNELVTRLNSILFQSDSVVMADVIIEPSTNDIFEGDIDLRYSSFGTAVFLSAPFETNRSSPNLTIPVIQFEDVPITTGIESLARQAGINYSLDPKIRYSQADRNGQIKPEPVVSLRWLNITARQALLALLNQYKLQLDEDSQSNASVTTKPPDELQIYASTEVQAKVGKLFQNLIGTNVIGAQDFIFFTRPLPEIKPARIVLHSESIPSNKELLDLFTQLFPNATKVSPPKIQIKSVGPNSFQIVLSAFSAADYLKRTDQFKADFDLIQSALKRPYARMDGDYDVFFTTPIPNYVAVRVVAQTLTQRAQCHLLLAQPNKAFVEITLIHQLCRLLEGAPTGKPMTLVSALINAALTELYVKTLADGMRLHAWHTSELEALQSQLKEINLLPFMFNAVQGEWAGMSSFLESYLAGAPDVQKLIGDEGSMGRSVTPGGWLYQNLVSLSWWNQKAMDSFDLTNNLISPANLDEFQRGLKDLDSSFHPYSYWVALVVPDYSKGVQTLVYDQTRANEAQVVCALERYHLTRGEYPETLDALVPQFIEIIPHDIIGGQQLQYRRTNDGKFLLYSIGWNETDDGGQDTQPRKNNWDYTKGDWVWTYSAN